jgi:hypothetical protein
MSHGDIGGTVALPSSDSIAAILENEQGGFDWATLVALTVHPLKVGIIEALRYLGHPLSANELTNVLADSHYSPDLISYHAGGLVKLGVLEVTETYRIRGAVGNYYYFSR